MGTVYVARRTQLSVLRQFAINQIGSEAVAYMSDSEIVDWLEDQGYQSYIEHTGNYDDSDDVLIAKVNDIDELVSEGRAFWATRSGRMLQ